MVGSKICRHKSCPSGRFCVGGKRERKQLATVAGRKQKAAAPRRVVVILLQATRLVPINLLLIRGEPLVA